MDQTSSRLDSMTLSVTVNRNWRQLYDEFWRPEEFPRWASGLSDASLTNVDGKWRAKGPEGPIEIIFSGHNAYGIMDHRVRLNDDRTVYIPLRVIENGDGAEVLLTLFRQPGMSDVRFAGDADWVRRDLERLRELAEQP
ncbi:polyketide cyclase [Paraburkholderia susongensis]|uniref:Polyketide cyclase / dehydrase and lipid transport n=1 Tax=Paraburkholderia susongensis TaxID=1515439 RepID=A0A1X7LHY5_9BURK|nr:polyketide cyclase [Paraburkholderia susongensis]SMG53498.1 hypothetical protein SAMN06265784_106169 [Paraburkholderia susongensis]